jgi:hypothetical protein
MNPLDKILAVRREALISHAELYPLDGDPTVLIGWQKVFDLIREDLERLEFAKERCQAVRAAVGR